MTQGLVQRREHWLVPFAPWTAAISYCCGAREIVMVSTPLGTAVGGPLVSSLGASGTLAVSGLATLLLAAAASVLWTGDRAKAPTSPT